MVRLYHLLLALLSATLLACGGGGGSSGSGDDRVDDPNVDTQPVAADEIVDAQEDTPIPIFMLSNDDFKSDGRGEPPVVIDEGPSNGTYTLETDDTSGAGLDYYVNYVPNPDFHGTDSFTYSMVDADGDTATATTTINVASVNDFPLTEDDHIETNKAEPVDVLVLANDSFGGDGAGTIEIVTGPMNGAAQVMTSGTPDDVTDDFIRYTPEAEYTGRDTVVYQITDSDGDSIEAEAIIDVIFVPKLKLSIDYPLPLTNLYGAKTLTVAGRLEDTEDGVVSASDTDYIDVNGVLAVQDADSEAEWSATIDLPPGSSIVTVSVAAANGDVDELSFDIFNEPLLMSSAIAFDPTEQRIIAATDRIIAINPLVDTRETLVDESVGTGPSYGSLDAIALSADAATVYSLDKEAAALFSIDLTTGNRSLVSSEERGAGDIFETPTAIALSSSGDKLYVVEQAPFLTESDLWEVDISTGDRIVISEGVAGSATALVAPSAITINADGTQAFVADTWEPSIVKIDLGNGERVLLSGETAGTGQSLSSTEAIVFDEANERLLVAGGHSLMSVSVATGDREVLVEQEVGEDQRLTSVRGLALDSFNGDIFVLADDGEVIFQVFPEFGTADIRVSNEAGSGVYFAPYEILLSADGTTIYGRDLAHKSVTAYNILTGERTEVFSTEEWEFTPGSRVAVTSSEEEFLFANQDESSIVAFDPETNQTRSVTGNGIGTGPELVTHRGIAHGPGGELLVIDYGLDAIVAVDPVSGDREIVTGVERGAGEAWNDPNDLLYDEESAQILLLTDSALIVVDRASGDRTVISDDDTHAGPTFASSGLMDLDGKGNVIVLADRHESSFELIRVALDTGERVSISAAFTGIERNAHFSGLVVDPEHERAFVASFNELLVLVDLESGERFVVSETLRDN